MSAGGATALTCAAQTCDHPVAVWAVDEDEDVFRLCSCCVESLADKFIAYQRFPPLRVRTKYLSH